MRRCFWVGPLVVVAACGAGIKDSPRIAEAPSKAESIVDDTVAPTYSATASVEGQVLVVQLYSQETCVFAGRIDEAVTSRPCHRRAVTNRDLVITAIGVTWQNRARSDDQGIARFSLHDAPEPESGVDGWNPGWSFTIGDGEMTLPVALASESTRSLVALLAADPTSRIARDRENARRLVEAANAAAEAQLVAAKQALASCQRNVDESNLTNASQCWRDHEPDWMLLTISEEGVPACLETAATTLDEIANCLRGPERTDDQILAKGGCLMAFELMTPKCGALDLAKLREERQISLDIARIKKRIDTKAAPIIERQARQAARENAKAKACAAKNVLAVVATLQIGNDLDPALMKECVISVVPGRVINTTRDGWMLVRWGDNYVAAFRTRKAHADGSLLRTSATARYLGLRQFDMVNGRDATLATFKLSE